MTAAPVQRLHERPVAQVRVGIELESAPRMVHGLRRMAAGEVGEREKKVRVPGQAIDPDGIADFLNQWSCRKYEDERRESRIRKKFGLSRATTLLHFMSGGSFPIFDSRVRRALIRLTVARVPYTILCYLELYRPIFLELARACDTYDLRAVDKALFSYGKKTLRFLD